MSTAFANRAKILDVHETRGRERTHHFDYRQDDRSGKILVEGYAATYEPYEVYGGPDRGGWTEQIEPRAFDVTLASRPDLVLLINHEGAPLARTTAGNLQVTRDHRGLRVRAQLDPHDPDVQRLMPKLKPQPNGKAIMDEMSFGFRVKDQIWDESYTQRTITELSLQKGDVSIVNYGANPSTAVAVCDAVDALAQMSRHDLLELWGLIECRDDDDPKKPYGDVKYADPGYKDGVKRYPIDTEAHARAAWSYINMPKNQSGYTAEQVATIKGHIKAALKKFGVDVADDKKALPYSAPAPGVTRADFLPVSAGADDPPNHQEEEEEEVVVGPAGPEAFTRDTGERVSVGSIQATLAAVRQAADPAGLRRVAARRAEFAAVSLPPTLAP